MKYLLEGQETQRLKFRLLQNSDFETWIDLFRKEGVARFVALDHLATPEEQCQMWFERAFTRYNDERGGLNVLIDKQTNQLVGQCGLLIQEVDSVTRMEVGYSVLPQFWCNGYATEAAIKCRDYAFENNFTDSLISIIHIENVSSMKVAANNGMKLQTTTVYKGFPVNIFQITKKEWLKIKNDGKG